MKFLLIYLLFFITLVYSCDNAESLRLNEYTGFAQGTTFQIKYLSKNTLDFDEEINSIFSEIDSSMSTYLPVSTISKINAGGVFVEVDSMFMEVLERSIQLAEESNGDFDPTIGPLVELWGFGFKELRQDVSDKMIAEAKEKTGYKKIEIDGNKVRIPNGFSLDLNAIAQGFTVDHISNFLESKDIENYMVEVGGEVRAKGMNEQGKVWKIGIDKPQSHIDNSDRFQFILKLEDAALATSGNYRKFWVDEKTGIKYSHTIDPKTGKPAFNKLLSVSVIAPTAMDADAYATVCMVKGLERCKEFMVQKKNMHVYMIYSDSSGMWNTYHTKGFDKYIVDKS